MEMANILILGGGFGGVVAAEWLAKELGPEHHTIYPHKGLWVDEPTINRAGPLLELGQANSREVRTGHALMSRYQRGKA